MGRGVLLSLVSMTIVVSCNKPLRPFQVAAADQAAIAGFFGRLKHDPALFVVIRPDRLAFGTASLQELARSLGSAESETFARGLPHLAHRNRSGIWQLVEIFDGGWPSGVAGWDEHRPVLAALDGTGREEDLSLLFRAFLADPGDVAFTALHHTVSIPATDSRTLSASLASLLAKHGFPSLPGGPLGGAFFGLRDAGFVALLPEEGVLRVEIVTEESPVTREQDRTPARRMALLTNPPDAAQKVEPFEELAGSGADAVVVHLRPRNFFRRDFVRWLGIVADNMVRSDPFAKHTMLAKGTAELLGVYPLMSRTQGAATVDVAVGLALTGGVGVRIASSGATGNGPDHRTDMPLARVFDEKWYRAAALVTDIERVPARELPDALEGGGLSSSAFVLATDPNRALPALAASRTDSSSRFPVKWIAAPPAKRQRSPGAECLARAARAMQSYFEAAADLPPVFDDHRPAADFGAFSAALDCAETDDRVAAQARSIRLAKTLVDAERLAAGLHRDEAARLLATACSKGNTEACSRESDLNRMPQVRLPSVRFCAEFSLPGPGASVFSIDSGGKVHEATPNRTADDVVLEVDGAVRHGAVTDTLSRLGQGTRVFAPVRGDDGEIVAIPIPLRRAEASVSGGRTAVLHFPRSGGEATLVGPDGTGRSIKVTNACAAAPPCPLATAFKDLQARFAGNPPVVFLDIAPNRTWSETLMVVANALCLDPGGGVNQSATAMALLPPSASAGSDARRRQARP